MKILLIFIALTIFRCKHNECIQKDIFSGYEACNYKNELSITFKNEKYAKNDVAFLGVLFIINEVDLQSLDKISVKSTFYPDSVIIVNDNEFTRNIIHLRNNAKFRSLSTYMLDSLSLESILTLDKLFSISNDHKKYLKQNEPSFINFMVQCFLEGSGAVENELRQSLFLSLLFEIRNLYLENEGEKFYLDKNVIALKKMIGIIDPEYEIKKTTDKFILDLEKGGIKEEGGVPPRE